MNLNGTSRRSFLKKSLVISAAASIGPRLLFANKNLPKPINTLVSPNERINLAWCGIGNRAGDIALSLYNTGLVNIVALCDVDLGAPHTLKILKQFPHIPRFTDFRSMFDKLGNEIDAVSIGVPDHSHFPITMMAMALGKHVYVEKPLARTFLESELLLKAANKYNKVVTQMGNQGHSEANYFQFKTWVDAGIIKDVTKISAHMNYPRRWHGWNTEMKSFPQKEKIPTTLDWNEWLGTAEHHDFNKDFINGQWRCWYDFGLGALGDWGAHIIDTAHEFLDLGLPQEIDPVKLDGHNHLFFPQASTLKFKFPERHNMPPVEITWYDGVDNLPPIPAGYGISGLDPTIPPPSTGELKPTELNPGKIIYSKDYTFKGGSHGSVLSIISQEGKEDITTILPEVPESSSDHFQNFLLACKDEEKARSRFEISAPLSQVLSLGVISQQLNEKILIDREKKTIIGNEVANALLKGVPPRKGWEQYYQI